jgi:long-chain acyl-CoA synthetase
MTPARRLRALAAEQGDRVAVRSSGGVWTYRELDALADAQARGLSEVGDGGAIALLASADARPLACFFAAFRARRVLAPISSESLEPTLNALDADALIVDRAHEDAATRIPRVKVFHLEDLAIPRHPHLNKDPEKDQDKDADGDEIALVHFTSGSQGRPRGVSLSHRSLLAGALSYGASIHLTARDRVAWVQPQRRSRSGPCCTEPNSFGSTRPPVSSTCFGRSANTR